MYFHLWPLEASRANFYEILKSRRKNSSLIDLLCLLSFFLFMRRGRQAKLTNKAPSCGVGDVA